jgi:hypothetical protein
MTRLLLLALVGAAGSNWTPGANLTLSGNNVTVAELVGDNVCTRQEK